MLPRVRDRIFYGWVIVAASVVIAGSLMGIRLSYGVFFKSIQSEFELSRAVTSSVYSAYMVASAVLGIVTGWVLDRYGPRLAVFLMGLFTGLSLLVTSQTTSLWQLFLSYGLLLAMGTAAPMPVLVTIISRWFHEKLGTATGITASGNALGVFAVAPFAAYLISELGWRMSFLVIGLIVWLVVMSLAMLMRRDPAEIGTWPDGVRPYAPETRPSGAAGSLPAAGPSLSQALKTRSFWLMSVILVLDGFTISLVTIHLVPYATDSGISTIEAAAVLSVVSVFQIPARLLVGRVSDIVGPRILGVISGLLGIGAFTWLIWADSLWPLYLVAAVFGLSLGGLGVVRLVLMSDLWGGRNLGLIMGVLVVGWSMGSALGSALGGLIFDIADSYVVAFAAGAAVMLVIALLYSAISTGPSNTEAVS